MHNYSKKVIKLQAWAGSLGYRRMRLPEFLNNRDMKMASLSNTRTSQAILLVLISVRG